MCSRMSMLTITRFYSSNHARFELLNRRFIEASVTTHLVYQKKKKIAIKGSQQQPGCCFSGFIDFLMRKEDENGSTDDAETKLKFSRVSTN